MRAAIHASTCAEQSSTSRPFAQNGAPVRRMGAIGPQSKVGDHHIGRTIVFMSHSGHSCNLDAVSSLGHAAACFPCLVGCYSAGCKATITSGGCWRATDREQSNKAPAVRASWTPAHQWRCEPGHAPSGEGCVVILRCLAPTPRSADVSLPPPASVLWSGPAQDLCAWTPSLRHAPCTHVAQGSVLHGRCQVPHARPVDRCVKHNKRRSAVSDTDLVTRYMQLV